MSMDCRGARQSFCRSFYHHPKSMLSVLLAPLFAVLSHTEATTIRSSTHHVVAEALPAYNGGDAVHDFLLNVHDCTASTPVVASTTMGLALSICDRLQLSTMTPIEQQLCDALHLAHDLYGHASTIDLHHNNNKSTAPTPSSTSVSASSARTSSTSRPQREPRRPFGCGHVRTRVCSERARERLGSCTALHRHECSWGGRGGV